VKEERLFRSSITSGSPVDVLLDRFVGYLSRERGVTVLTVDAYVSDVRRFLAHRGRSDLVALTAAEVSKAVLGQVADRSPASVRRYGCALRSVLRYWYMAGLVEHDLSAAALPVPGWRRSLLPQGVSPLQAKALLGACLLRWWRAGSLGDTEPVINSRSALSSAPAGYRFPRQVIAVAVRSYLRYGLSYRDVEELLAERGIVVDHVTVYRRVQAFTPSSSTPRVPAGPHPATGSSSTRPTSRSPTAGPSCRAVDQHGQVVDVLIAARRDLRAARTFFSRALRAGTAPVEVTTDRTQAYPAGTGRTAPGCPARH
jgi:hypothetical protein